MSKIVDKRINQLQVELEWLDYNLNSVGGISDTLLAAEAKTRMHLLGKKSYLSRYLQNPHGITSDFQRSLSYNRNIENTLFKMREGVTRRLENVKSLKK